MTTHDPIPARLAALKTMPVAQLKEQWRELFGTEPPPYTGRSSRAGWPTGCRSSPMAG